MNLFKKTLNKEYIIKNQQHLIDKLEVVAKDLSTRPYSFEALIGYSISDLKKKIKKGNAEVVNCITKRISLIYDIKTNTLLNADKNLDVTCYNPLIEKLKGLNDYLITEKGINLARAISMHSKKMDAILSADRKISKSAITKIAEYFLMTYSAFMKLEQLPPKDELLVDEELLKIQVKDTEDRISFFKNHHYIRKNFRVLGHSKRIQLIFSLLCITIPLVAYTGYCAFLVSKERIETVEKYRRGSDESEIYDKYDATQKDYHEKLQTTDKINNPNAYYVDVTVGSKLYRISDISSSTNSYITRMELYFKFDRDEFNQMFEHYATNVLSNLIVEDYKQGGGPSKPNTQTMESWINEHRDYVDTWISNHAKEYYPGETPSNVLTDKQTMFDIGNGGFVADSYGTVKELEEIEYYDENNVLRVLCYQKVKFEAKFEKAFDSYRYPLDSIQLKMYIQPTLDANYMRYTPDREVNSSNESLSGFSSYFKLTNGYRLINEKDNIKNFTQKVNYYQDVNNDPSTEFEHTYKTQLEIIVRANRQGISLFLQAFVNLFSVTIWICIAFYNQSYNGEDSIGMLGTGLFGAISSVLVGISMVSDAGLFSLITMINIFTLGVIMIMTQQSILARRAVVKQDKIQIAYNGVKLRITFFLLIACTILMFAGLPMISYLFGL